MKKAFLIICCCLVTMACKGQDHGAMASLQMAAAEEAATPAQTSAAANMRAEIETMIAERACDTDAQCHVIGLGSRPCGGFEDYDVYSDKNIDTAALEKLATAYFKQHQQENEENGVMGICVSQLQPQSKCLANQCVIDVMATLEASEPPHNTPQ